MGLIQTDIAARLGEARRVAVIASEGSEGVLPAAVVALALEAAGHAPSILVRQDAPGTTPIAPGGGSWAAALAEWYAEQERDVPILSWDGEDPIDADIRIAAGTGALLHRPPPAHCTAVAVIGPAPEDEASLSTLVAHGGVLAVELVARFGSVGRHFVEMVEHVHHRVGPTAQSTAADALRAALFGRHGQVPVNLATRESPVSIGPASTLVWWIDPEELT